jgi:hypothetical protein
LFEGWIAGLDEGVALPLLALVDDPELFLLSVADPVEVLSVGFQSLPCL